MNRSKKGKIYRDIVTAFDIETTGIEEIEQSVMYIWQWQFGPDLTVIGRTWEEFLTVVRELRDCLNGDYLVVYVHNLSYEFQFLRGIYSFEQEEVFAVKSRKVLRCFMLDCLEFRCSYLHSNMNLDTYLAKFGVEHKKLTLDYSKKRYPWTELSDEELAYCVNDVKGLVEALTVEMKHDGDTLYTIPLTSTGYVRRDAKKAMRKCARGYIVEQLPDYETYKMLREAFRGGNTHANRFYSTHIIHDVSSADRSSSYPDVMLNCMFPVSKFYKMGERSYKYVLDLLKQKGKAGLFRCAFSGIRLRRQDWGCPYLAVGKCRKVTNPLQDNGRILEADYLETTLTDVDLKIVLQEYAFEDVVFMDVAYARYGRLPLELRKTIIEYYRLKTELKGVEGQELLYMKSKNKLNSLYGMCAQDPVKQDILYILGQFTEQHEDPEGILENNNKRAFLTYAWGVWVTAWARLRLEEGLLLAHGDVNNPNAPQFIYCDTDSVKYTGEINWDDYNARRKADSKASGAFATDPKGETHYMGVFEMEHSMVDFCTMGAKKYVSRETYNSPLTLTVAGVSKKKGAEELERAGGIEQFKEGFVFWDAGGLEAVYNDSPEISYWEVEGRKLAITSNVYLKPSTYTLGLSADYARLLTTISSEEFDL